MSHFTVVVCLKDIGDLEQALAPFDENAEVEPYKDYKKGKPEEHWMVKKFREEGELPAGDITWQQLADALNARYHNNKTNADPKQLVDEKGMYTMSTYNPNSKWDWYQVGGRWSDYFKAKDRVLAGEGLVPILGNHLLDNMLITGARSWGMDGIPKNEGWCDGGPKGLLDLAGMRKEKGEEAGKRYDDFHTMADGLFEKTVDWPDFVKRVDAGEITIDAARNQYHAQPLLERMRKLDEWRWDGNIEQYRRLRQLHVVNAEAGAVPGYAILTLDGRWMAPGEMGWFGMSTDDGSSRIGYLEVANAYIESLPDDVVLVAVDCHI